MLGGPDALAPADSFITVLRDAAVKLHTESSGPLSDKPLSIPTVLNEAAKKHPNQVAIAVKRDGEWKEWNYKQYIEDVRRVAKSFIKLGLEPYHGVGILGFNSPEWFMADLGAILAGGFAVGVYTTNSADSCQFVLSNSESNICVVENNTQLQKILSVWEGLPCLKAIIQYSGPIQDTKGHSNVYTWDDFMSLGESVTDQLVEERIQSQAPNKCCTLIYTSGTTGTPKGTMISHDNLVWTAKMCLEAVGLDPTEMVIVSYLPLSHIAAQMLDILAPIINGGSVYFAQPDALKGSLAVTLREVRPTVFLGVPRVWEKMQEKMIEISRQSSLLQRKVAGWAKDVGYRGNLSIMNGGSVPYGWTFANFIFKKVRRSLGLDRCKMCLTSAAPITKETLEFFMSLDIILYEIYGMSESSGPHTISKPDSWRLTSVGKEFPGATTRMDNMDQDGNGEVCMMGRHIFMGYLNAEEKTKEALDDGGWLHSGDVGKKDADGFLYITGRIKELIITAGGENVAPVPIEDTVKEELPVVSNCMLVGDKKKFLSLLITLKVELDGENVTEKLTGQAQEWCKSMGSSATTVTQILDQKDKSILAGIQAGIDKVNKKAPSNAQKIQKWSILPRDFSIAGGELGPTMKLRRPIVAKMYTNTINAFYE